MVGGGQQTPVFLPCHLQVIIEIFEQHGLHLAPADAVGIPGPQRLSFLMIGKRAVDCEQ